VYALLSGDIYERKGLFSDEDFEIRETYPAQESALAKVWDDPELDIYNDVSGP
jgi:hypothetical protein